MKRYGFNRRAGIVERVIFFIVVAVSTVFIIGSIMSMSSCASPVMRTGEAEEEYDNGTVTITIGGGEEGSEGGITIE